MRDTAIAAEASGLFFSTTAQVASIGGGRNQNIPDDGASVCVSAPEAEWVVNAYRSGRKRGLAPGLILDRLQQKCGFLSSVAVLLRRDEFAFDSNEREEIEARIAAENQITETGEQQPRARTSSSSKNQAATCSVQLLRSRLLVRRRKLVQMRKRRKATSTSSRSKLSVAVRRQLLAVSEGVYCPKMVGRKDRAVAEILQQAKPQRGSRLRLPNSPDPLADQIRALFVKRVCSG